MVETAVLTIEEAAAVLALGRSKTYALVASGVLPSIRLGRALRVPRRMLDSWIEAQAQGSLRGS